MQITDLGEIDGPVLLFGGVYGNLQALEAVLKVARGLGLVAKRRCVTNTA